MMDAESAKGSFALAVNISPLLVLSESHLVTNEQSGRQAISMALQARKMLKVVEDIRKRLVDPYLKSQRSINELAKFYEEQLQSIEVSLSAKIDTWIENISETTDIHQEISVSDGTFKKTKEWDYEIEDKNKIYSEYLMVDEKKVKEAIKMGVRFIPGIKIYQKETSKLRINNKQNC